MWANNDSHTDGNYPMFIAQTANNINYDLMYWASNTGYSAWTTSERGYGDNVMDIPQDGYVTSRKIFNSGDNPAGTAKVTAVSINSITI
jgi:hypothetical protein